MIIKRSGVAFENHVAATVAGAAALVLLNEVPIGKVAALVHVSLQGLADKGVCLFVSVACCNSNALGPRRGRVRSVQASYWALIAHASIHKEARVSFRELVANLMV